MTDIRDDNWTFSQLYENEEDGIKQDSPEWHVWRSKGLGSSDAPILMGQSPWKEIGDLFLEKTGEKKNLNKTNWAIERGKLLEPVARDIYNWEKRCEMRPRTFVHRRYSFMRASMDGFSSHLGYGIEIKVPGQKDIASAKNGVVPKKYYPQLQWLMSCSGSTKIDYCTLDAGNGGLHIMTVFLDHEYERRMIALARWFWFLLSKKAAPPMRTGKGFEIDPSGNRLSKLQGGKVVVKRSAAQTKLGI